jgi:hypothetical protein
LFLTLVAISSRSIIFYGENPVPGSCTKRAPRVFFSNSEYPVCLFPVRNSGQEKCDDLRDLHVPSVAARRRQRRRRRQPEVDRIEVDAVENVERDGDGQNSDCVAAEGSAENRHER